jgi:hypothetical protein
MKNTSVPLVVYDEQGKKKVIGDALVHYDGYGNLALVASISDVAYQHYIGDDLKSLSIHTKG